MVRSPGRADPDACIAIIGMACRLPGDVDSPDALWRLVCEGRDAVGQPAPERLASMSFAGGAGPEGGPPEGRSGGYLRDVTRFDAQFFGISGREADVLDPQQRLLLEVAWEALEHAGLPPEQLTGSSTGVFAGLSYHDYMDGLAGGPGELEGAVLTNGHCVAAGRISYALGLHGPAVSVDTACSSSLVALHLAVQALRTAECDLALAGGVSLILDDRTTRSFSRMRMLSPTGRCRSFDAAADGFVRGEGCGIVAVKRLADAARDGDRVLAVIRGSAVNQDGRSDGLAAPSAAAQRAVILRALEAAGVDPRDVGMVEAHGTGTPVGDPIEFSALAQVYGAGPGRCALGSVKSNIGHLEPAAGVIGVIKAVQCLRRGLVPPSLHFNRWNPALAAEATRFFVPTRPTPWAVPAPTRLAAVSSFGFSGTNAHVILEQAAGDDYDASTDRDGGEGGPHVFLVAAGSARALPRSARALAGWLEGDGAGTPLRDLAHTLAVRRSAGRGRLGVVADSRSALISTLRSYANGQVLHPSAAAGEVASGIVRKPVWVFSGQGSQWAGMGRALLETEPAFAAALSAIDPLIEAEAGFSVVDLVRSGAHVSGCERVQPVLFALQVALAGTWRAYGVEPAAVIGHSMGEVAAAVVAGALSPADGARVICRRSALLSRIAGQGAMAGVALGRDAVERDLAAAGAPGVSVAVLASPSSTIVAGPPDQIESLVEAWSARAVPAQLIAVDVASHCPQVDPLLGELAETLSDLTAHRAEVPFYSTVLDDPRQTPDFDGAYWCANLRSPVRFESAIQAAAADRHTVYVEVSAHPVLHRAVLDSLADAADTAVVLPTLRRDEDDAVTFRTALAALHCAGGRVDWNVLYPDGELADPPFITFDRTRHWAGAPDQPPERPQRPRAAAAALPGTRTDIPGQPARACWSADAGTRALPWLNDHRVNGTRVFPGSGYWAVALTVGCEALRAAPHEIEAADFELRRLLPVAEQTELKTVVTLHSQDHGAVEIFAPAPDGTWVSHAAADLRRRPPAAQPEASRPQQSHPPFPVDSPSDTAARHPVSLDPAAFYAGLHDRGLEHGSAFAGVSELSSSPDGTSFWARVDVPPSATETPDNLLVHPVLLDLCAQILMAGLSRQRDGRLILPIAAKSVRLPGDPRDARYCHARVTETGADRIVGDILLLDAVGAPVAVIDGLTFLRHGDEQGSDVRRWFLETSWRTAAPAANGVAVDGGTWVVIGGDGRTDLLASALRAAGATTETIMAPLDAAPLGALRGALCERWSEGPAPRAVVVALPSHVAVRDPAEQGLRHARRLLDVAQAVSASFAEPPRLFAVTHCAHAVAAGERPNLSQGAVRGVLRVLACEYPELRATHVDADSRRDTLDAVAMELLAADAEDEVTLRGYTRHVARLAYAPETRVEPVTASVNYARDGVRLMVGRFGDLSRLELVARARRPPGPDEVELRVHAAGINFRDVLTAMGLLGEDRQFAARIGFECSGEVTAVGRDVKHLRVGDTVISAGLQGGAFASFTTVPAAFVAPLPAGVDPIAAAGIPTAFTTAWYALRRVARLAPRERVLVHSATGGTGLAALQVAGLLEAEVLATAGSRHKRGYLRDQGVEHVMDSRGLDFADQARAATGGEGVDVVLNSLSGPAIKAGLRALRPFGRFVELGVRDILADQPLGMATLRHNITLRSVDLIELQHSRPDEFATVLRAVLNEIAHGRLTALPHRTFPLAEADDAFRLMAAAGHIGKLILTVPASGRTTAVATPPPPVRHDGSYLVTGGLRGVGLETVRWLIEQGAGQVIANGRTPPGPDAERILTRLRERGARITVVLGDIAETDTAERLIAAAEKPLRGVVHAAMVLDDAAIANITEEQLARVWRPKVTGAWRLHNATAGHLLDWFVLYSSMTSLLGNPGQGAYAAANSWLDAFAAWRTGLGLRTLAVNWGPWGETGAGTGFAARGYHTIPTAAGLRALRELITSTHTRAGVIPGDPDTWIPNTARRSPLFTLLADDAAPAGRTRLGEDVRATLASLDSSLVRRNALEKHLAEQIRDVLRLRSADLDPQTPLKNLGFDSLLSMELRARLQKDLGVTLSPDFVYRHPTVAALVAGLERQLNPEPAPGDAAPR